MCVTLILNEQFTDTEIYLTEFHNAFLKKFFVKAIYLQIRFNKTTSTKSTDRNGESEQIIPTTNTQRDNFGKASC